jgi:uncharacterized RDD family membrane protein YckC
MDSLDEMYNLDLPKERFSLITARVEKRFLAFIIDFFILELFIYAPLIKPFEKFFSGGVSSIVSTLQNIPDGLILTFIASASVLSILYFSLFDYYLQGTPGKLLVGIRVSKITLLTSFIRNLSAILIFPFNWLIIIDIYFLFKRKYRWLEKISGSYSYERVRIV